MRALLVAFFLFVFGALLIVLSMTYEVSYDIPAYAVDETTAPQISARAWGVFDTETGRLLFGRDVHETSPIASVAKLMTAEVALATMNPEATTTLSRDAVATEGRAGGLAAGEVLSIGELLFPLLLSSSNDAAEAIAEYGGREAFITAMNATALELGMVNTTFGDPSGLSAANVSSVMDLAKLLQHLVHTRQYVLNISRLQKYVGPKHTWPNVDKVASLDTFRGGKHGYTDEANRTLAAVLEEELSSGNTRGITVVLLGSDNLQADVETIRSYLHGHVAYRQGEASSAILHPSSLWNLLTLRSTENTARALLPIFADKSRL